MPDALIAAMNTQHERLALELAVVLESYDPDIQREVLTVLWQKAMDSSAGHRFFWSTEAHSYLRAGQEVQ